MIKGAGLPKLANGYLNCALQNKDITDESKKVLPLTNTGEVKKLDAETLKWILEGKDLTDYRVGMVIPSGNLKSTFIKGGKLLVDKPYVMQSNSLI